MSEDKQTKKAKKLTPGNPLPAFKASKKSEAVNVAKAKTYTKGERKKHNTFSKPVLDSNETPYFPSQYGDEKLKERLTDIEKKTIGLSNFLTKDINPTNVRAKLEDKDIDTLIDYQKMTELVEFDKQFTKLFNFGKAEELERAKKIYPSYFDNKLQFIMKVAKLQRELAYITLYGARTKADLDLLITGRLAPSKNLDLYSIIHLPPHKLLEMKDDDSVKLNNIIPGYVRFPYYMGPMSSQMFNNYVEHAQKEKSRDDNRVVASDKTPTIWKKDNIPSSYNTRPFFNKDGATRYRSFNPNVSILGSETKRFE